jgi:hypothetical protein
VEAFHFYTLNRAELTRAVCRLIGIAAEPAENLPASQSAAAGV